jgi:hypothetical protein
MDSDTDSSNSSLLPTLDSVETGSKRGTAASTTWAHTRPARDGEALFHRNAPIKYCIYCTESSYGTSVTTNMRNHLKSKHQISIEAIPGIIQQTTINQLQRLYAKAESLGQTQQIDIHAFRKILNQDIIDEALVSLIVVRNLPFSLVEWPEFHTLCQVLNPESDRYIVCNVQNHVMKVAGGITAKPSNKCRSESINWTQACQVPLLRSPGR